MNIKEIFNVLFEGKKLALTFDTASEARTFRTKLFRYKTAQETVLLATEVLDERYMLIFRETPLLLPVGAVQCKFWLEERGPTKQYDVTILEDDEG